MASGERSTIGPGLDLRHVGSPGGQECGFRKAGHKILIALDTLKKSIPVEGVLIRLHSTRPISSNHNSPVLPFWLSAGLRADEANLAYDAMRNLIGCSALKLGE